MFLCLSCVTFSHWPKVNCVSCGFLPQVGDRGERDDDGVALSFTVWVRDEFGVGILKKDE